MTRNRKPLPVWVRAAFCMVVVGLGADPARGSLVAIGPFVGERSETFNQYTNTQAVQTLPVFSNTATLKNRTAGGAIKVEFSSQLGGDLVVPRAGMMAGQLGVGGWEFQQPAVRFGGYFENNSGADDATLSFYAPGGALLGTVTARIPAAAQAWTWNGWESAVPFDRIEIVGNGVINGFIWYEDMQVTHVPEPAAGVALLVVLHLLMRRRA